MKFPHHPINNDVLIFDKGASWWANMGDTKSLNSAEVLAVIVSMYFDDYVNSMDALINTFFKNLWVNGKCSKCL